MPDDLNPDGINRAERRSLPGAPKLIQRSLRTVTLLLYAALVTGGLWLLPSWWEGATRDYAGDLNQPLPAAAQAQYQFIRRHLQQPFAGKYERNETLFDPSFPAVALSHMACGLFNVALADPSLRPEVVPLLHETVRRALAPGVSGHDGAAGTLPLLPEKGLYFMHLNLVLGCYRAASGDTQYDAAAERISCYLRASSLRDGDFHMRSDTLARSNKWPADQSAVLCSLYLYDRIHQTQLSAEPIAGWRRYLAEHATDAATGLPHSSLSPDYMYSPIPRGCALSWMTLYLAQFAPDLARETYKRYRSGFLQNIMGMGGFREWPPGLDGGHSLDGGIVFLDIGLAATGIGAGSTRLYRDAPAYTLLQRTAAMVGLARESGGIREYRLAPLLGEAIFFHGITARRWYGEQYALFTDEPVPPPLGPVLLLFILITIMALAGWRLLIIVLASFRA